MTAFITCSLFLLSRTVHSESFLTDLYGKTPEASQSIYLDQGRVDYIKWGLSSDGTTANGAAILYISGSSTDGEWSFNYGDCSRCSPCDPVDVASDDYIIGYKIYYGDAYVFGLELYTYQGETFSCYDSDSVSGKSTTSNTYYNSASDFDYLSGWKEISTEDQNQYYAYQRSVQLQFTNIATVEPVVHSLPNSSFTASSFASGWPPQSARYSFRGWSARSNSANESDWLSIDLGRSTKIDSIGTKGYGTGNVAEWTTKYVFSSSLDGVLWTNLTLNGNSDADTEVTHVFDDESVIAQYVRFYPLEWQLWRTMRVEVYGYDYVTAEYQPIATTMEPSGVERVWVFVGAVISFFAALAIFF